jgi:AraC-like DNA-binding protein
MRLDGRSPVSGNVLDDQQWKHLPMEQPANSLSRIGTARTFVSLAEILQEASAAVQDDPVVARACIARAAMLLREVQARHDGGQADAARGLGLARWQLSRVTAHVEKNIHRSLRIRDLAELAGLSAGHFARAFRQSVGVAPRSFVLERRVARAKTLMQKTDLPLSEVALACGLSDQAHLSRIFRRYTAITPNAWRREWHERGKHERCAATLASAESVGGR